jgi:hypothetical protein
MVAKCAWLLSLAGLTTLIDVSYLRAAELDPGQSEAAAPSTNAATPSDATTAAPPDKSGYSLLNPTPDAQMRAFATDRPPKANTAYTVDAGHFQIESDLVSYSYSNFAGANTRSYEALDPVWKLGLTNWADLELQFNGYQYQASHNDAASTLLARGAGFGDVILRTKINMFGNDSGNAALAVIPYVKLPSATSVISNGAVEAGAIAPLVLTLPKDFSLILMTEFDALKDANDNLRHANFADLINLSHPVPGIDGLTAYVELYGSKGTDAATPPLYSADMALSYLVTKTVQLDIGANIGLNDAAPKAQVYSGISMRF